MASKQYLTCGDCGVCMEPQQFDKIMIEDGINIKGYSCPECGTTVMLVGKPVNGSYIEWEGDRSMFVTQYIIEFPKEVSLYV